MRHSGAAAHMQHAEISPMLPQPHAACWSSAPQCTCTAQWVCKGALHCIRCGGASLRRGLTHRGAVSHRLNRRCGDPCIRLFHGATVPKSQCQSPCPPSFASRVVARYTMPAAWASQCQALCAPPRNLCTGNQRAPRGKQCRPPGRYSGASGSPYLPTSRWPHASKRAQQQ